MGIGIWVNMIEQSELKEGYFYYAEYNKDSMWDGWRFIGKITGKKVKKGKIIWFPYLIVKGEYEHETGTFSHDSAHFESIKGVSKTITGLRVYML